jgi:hypothetical protein
MRKRDPTNLNEEEKRVLKEKDPDSQFRPRLIPRRRHTIGTLHPQP